MRFSRTVLLGIIGVPTCVLLAGCGPANATAASGPAGGGLTAPQPAQSAQPAPAAGTVHPTVAPVPNPAAEPAAPSAANAAPKCVAGTVSGALAEHHAAPNGEVTATIVVTNTGPHACSVYGYGGVELYAGGDGRPLGIALARVAPGPVSVTLRPGGHAVKRLTWQPTQLPGSAPDCTAYPGIVGVILPDDTVAFEINAPDLEQVCGRGYLAGGAYQPA